MKEKNSIALEIKDLVKTYKLGKIEVPALRGVSFSVRQGEMVAIMGPSGCGKSTLMHLMGCLDRATSGKVLIDGVDVSTQNDNELACIRNKKIGFVFQAFNLLPKYTAEKNVELPLYYYGVKKEEREMRSHKILEVVGLEHRAHHKPTEISGGERQRIAIARALINDPSFIIADEPTGNLDSKTSEDIMRTFQKINKQGVTIILVTHEADIVRYTKRVLRMRDGQLLADEKVEQVVI